MPELFSNRSSPPRAMPRPPAPPRPTVRAARFAFGLFLFIHACLILGLRPWLVAGLCFYLWGVAAVVVAFPLALVILTAFVVSAVVLRRFLRQYRVAPSDTVVWVLRKLAVSIQIIEIGWFVIVVGLLLYAGHHEDSYGWRMCFPKAKADW